MVTGSSCLLVAAVSLHFAPLMLQISLQTVAKAAIIASTFFEWFAERAEVASQGVGRVGDCTEARYLALKGCLAILIALYKVNPESQPARLLLRPVRWLLLGFMLPIRSLVQASCVPLRWLVKRALNQVAERLTANKDPGRQGPAPRPSVVRVITRCQVTIAVSHVIMLSVVEVLLADPSKWRHSIQGGQISSSTPTPT